MDSLGTYGWIIHQHARNIDRIGRLPSFEELFAKRAVSDLTTSARTSRV
jgi:glutamate synthase (NADPH) large chain